MNTIGVINVILLIITLGVIFLIILSTKIKVVGGEKTYSGSEQCYNHYKTRHIRKFCLNTELDGYVKRFGYAHILQIYHYDFDRKWNNTSFVELKVNENGNTNFHSLYNGKEKLIYL